MLEMLTFPFMQRAILGGLFVSVCAALLGVSLVLKRYSMIGDGLSHVGFGALAIASALNFAPLAVSLPIVLVAAFFLLHISENSSLQGDSAIAVLSAGSLAIGVIIVSLTSGMNTDLNNFLFGSILAMEKSDVILSIALSVVVILLFVLSYHRIFAVTFDESFAKAIGLKSQFYNGIIASLTAVTIVLGMKMMGSLLISSLIIFPALSAMRISRTFLKVIILSGIFSVICFFAGICASFYLNTPAGATIVVANIAVFALSSTTSLIRK